MMQLCCRVHGFLGVGHLVNIWCCAGPPQLMMAFTDDGQVNDQLVADRDSRHGKNTAELRESRAKSVTPPQTTAPGADHWTLGKAWQTAMQLMDVKKH